MKLGYLAAASALALGAISAPAAAQMQIPGMTMPLPEKKKPYEPDRGPRPDTGYIALQSHDNTAVITFREVSVQPLTAKDKASLEKKLAR